MADHPEPSAIPLKEPFSSGYKIKRTVIPVEQKQKNQWSQEILYECG